MKYSSTMCPVLLFRLYKKGIYSFFEVEQVLDNKECFLLCYYFKKEIKDFDTMILSFTKPSNYNPKDFESNEGIDQMIEFGFIPSTVEYCLKYDDIFEFKKHFGGPNNYLESKAHWSLFEWGQKPPSLDHLTFSGVYGSIKCFKHLLLNGYCITDMVRSAVVCSGN